MWEVKAIIRPERLADVIHALHDLSGLPGVTVSQVHGYGRRNSDHPDEPVQYGEVAMVKLETVVPQGMADAVVATIRRAGTTNRAGDGKIFVSRVDRAVRVSDGDEGASALP
jgi:nitrogen regulatory protein P-II 1